MNTTRPDLPECFQQTVLVWVPAALLWACLPLHALQLALTPTLYSLRYKTPFNTFKIVSITLQVPSWMYTLSWILNHIYRPQRSWGKVIFSQASVILSTGGVCSRGVPGPGGLLGGRRVPGPGGVCSGGCLVWGGTWLGGSASGGPGGDPPGTATAAGGTHPTGMHSCWKLNCHLNGVMGGINYLWVLSRLSISVGSFCFSSSLKNHDNNVANTDQ